jgi:hypothetical protein
MPLFKINKQEGLATPLEEHEYKYEGRGLLSPQATIAKNPEIITGVPELGLVNIEIVLTCREYSTTSGPIDILLIGSNAEIIIVETKLIKNSESTRKVVAQVIDYIKAFGNETPESFFKKIEKSDSTFSKKYQEDSNFSALLDQNIKTGNYTVVVVGDRVHPNVLAMVESIQSAPHLAFQIYLVELDTYDLSEDEILITPKLLANTVEIERSVIRIEIDAPLKGYKIIAETPEKNGKGSRPILSWEEYLQNITVNEFAPIINNFRKRWVADIDDSINMGQVGFSAGAFLKGRRIPLQMTFDSKVGLISAKTRASYDIPEDLYGKYIDILKQSDHLYDKYIVSNKSFVPFEDIDAEELKLILDAAYTLGKMIKKLDMSE